MKKLIVVLGVVAFGFAFTACKKDCKCTYEMENPLVEGEKTSISYSSPDKLSKSDCESLKIPGLSSDIKVECKSE
jgi:hypothetical protein